MKKTKIFSLIGLSLALSFGVVLAQESPAADPAALAAPVQAAAPEAELASAPTDPSASSLDPAAQPASQLTSEPTASPATPSVLQTTQAVAQGAVSAGTESAGTLAEGGRSIASQGRALWSQILLPMWQRLATAMPSVVKAILVLFIFWLVAIVAGAGVRKALSLTRLDNRAAEEWGLGKMLSTADGKGRSIEGLAGGIVKWIILLFGFVAFFQALNLGMVAGPLQGIVGKIVGVVPNLMQAALILLVYWVLASLLRLAASRGLGAAGFDAKVSKWVPDREVNGEMVKPSGMIARLLFYVVLLFGLPPFLDALGQRALVAPLSEMLQKMLGFLPNILGAVIIFVIGHIIATIAREVVTNFLAATGADAGLQRIGLGGVLEKMKVSAIAGSVVYFFIIVPVIGAAVESLGVLAISEPVSATLQTLLSAVPLLFVAVVVAAVGYFLARIVSRIVASFLEGVGFNLLPEKLGLNFLRSTDEARKPSAITANVVMVVIILLTVQQALATLGLTQLSDLIGRFVAFLPQVLVALVVVLAALSLSSWAARLATAAFGNKGYGRLLAPVTRYSILLFGFGIALNELGIGEDLVTVAAGAVLGGACLALALAFGLGGRDRAQRLIEEVEGS